MNAGQEHELLVEAAKDPTVVRTLLRSAKVSGEVTDVVWPDGAHPPEASTEDTALSRIKIYRPDAVKLFTDAGKNTLAVAVEAQRSQNKKKRWSWVYYPGRLYMDHDCDALTLVITVADSMYRWSVRQHTKIPERFRSQIVVAGPAEIPSTLTDEQAAQSLGLAILVAAKRAATAPTSPPEPAFRALAIAVEEQSKTDPAAYALWYRLVDELFTTEEVERLMDIDKDWRPSKALQEVIGVEKVRLHFELMHERVDRAKERAQKDAEIAQKDAEVARAVVETVVEVRGWTLTPAQAAALATDDLEQLQAMRARAVTAERPEQLFLLD